MVKAATKAAAGSWSSVATLSGTGTAASPVPTIDTSNNVVAVWVQTSLLSVVSLQSSTKLSGGSWQALADTISGSTNTPSSPSVSVSSGGTIVAVWHSISGSNDLLNSASKTIAGGVWGSPINFFPATATFHHNYPKVIVDSSGNASSIWFRFSQSGSTYYNVDLLGSQLPSGSTAWSIASTLSEDSLRNPANLSERLRVDSSGNVGAIWISSFDGTTFNVETASKLLSGSWISGGALTLSNLYAFDVDAAVDSIGDAVAAHMYYDGSSTSIQSAESSVNSPTPNFWSASQTISQGNNNGYPRVATSISGNTVYACAVWIHDDGSNNVIHAATASKSAVLPPSNLSVTQNSSDFRVFTDYYNTITWQASPDPNLIGYAIYRNGIPFITVGSTTLQFVDHNATQGGL